MRMSFAESKKHYKELNSEIISQLFTSNRKKVPPRSHLLWSINKNEICLEGRLQEKTSCLD